MARKKMNPREDNKLDSVSGGYSGKLIETIFTTGGGMICGFSFGPAAAAPEDPEACGS